jgi:hypothetical protein
MLSICICWAELSKKKHDRACNGCLTCQESLANHPPSTFSSSSAGTNDASSSARTDDTVDCLEMASFSGGDSLHIINESLQDGSVIHEDSP